MLSYDANALCIKHRSIRSNPDERVTSDDNCAFLIQGLQGLQGLLGIQINQKLFRLGALKTNVTHDNIKYTIVKYNW